MHSAGSSAVMWETSKRRSASNWAYASRNDQPLDGISPIPRHFRGTTSKTSSKTLQCGPIALRADGPRVLVLDLGPACFELLDAQQHALEDIQRFETGDHDRHVVLPGDRFVFAVPMTAQTWPAARKPCTRLAGEPSTAHMAGGTNTCETNTEKFASPSRDACTTAMALAGAVVSKPTAKKTTCLSAFFWARLTASIGE